MVHLQLLTISGSDSGGRSGIQADLKTFASLGAYGCSVVTSVTAQNTSGMQGFEATTPSMVALQLSSVLSDFSLSGIKIGSLRSSQTIETITETLNRHFTTKSSRPPIVLDPSSGHSPLDATVAASLSALLPWTSLLIIDASDAIILSGWEGGFQSEADMSRVAAKLGALGAGWVLLRGVALGEGDETTSLIWSDAGEVATFEQHPSTSGAKALGADSSLSSAIAVYLAEGSTVSEAIRIATGYIASATAASHALALDNTSPGTIDHFHGLLPRSLLLPTPTKPQPFTDYLLNVDPAAWKRFVHHPFVIGVGNGTLPLKSFLHFIQQDYHFLKSYARTNALSAYKTQDMSEMAASMEITTAVIKETEMHVKYCEKYGISREELLAVEESVECVAYTRYELDVAMKGDLLDARVVTHPCLLGYGQVGAWLLAATEGVDKTESNPYWGWVKEYGGDWFQGAVKTGTDLLEETVVKSPISKVRLAELGRTFKKTTELEIAFWDAAMAAA
ncbi:hypothetical protein RQP46_001776 [Phenoliferia psychrophenolica]